MDFLQQKITLSYLEIIGIVIGIMIFVDLIKFLVRDMNRKVQEGMSESRYLIKTFTLGIIIYVIFYCIIDIINKFHQILQ